MPRAATSLKKFKAKSVLTKRQQDDSRHRMMQRVSYISNRVADCAEGKVEMTMAQLKAADMILGRTVPVLSAIQIVGEDMNENLSREEIESRIKEKIENNPMLGVLAGLTPNTIEGKASDVTEEPNGDE